MKNLTTLTEVTKPTSIESVKLQDGQMVTADTLTAIMEYSASLLRTALRSFLGCGVVCGLELESENAKSGEKTFVLTVSPGTIIDCHGHPLELCSKLKLDLSPTACSCEELPETICILMKRITSDELPHDVCSCDGTAAGYQCSRVRDHVLIRAIDANDLDELAGALCAHPDGEPNGKPESWTMCHCLSSCSDPCCEEESWVLLGCVNLKAPDGSGEGGGIQSIDTSRRKYVRPTECRCFAENHAGKDDGEEDTQP